MFLQQKTFALFQKWGTSRSSRRSFEVRLASEAQKIPPLFTEKKIPAITIPSLRLSVSHVSAGKSKTLLLLKSIKIQFPGPHFRIGFCYNFIFRKRIEFLSKSWRRRDYVPLFVFVLLVLILFRSQEAINFKSLNLIWRTE